MNKEFKHFFEEFFIAACRFTQHYTKESDTAVDIAQEAFVKVYEQWEDFKTFDNAKAFLYTIARNLSLNYLKHKQAENNYLQDLAGNGENLEQTFLKEVTRQETFRILYAAIGQLPRQTRQVILYSMEGDSVQDVGEKMNISVNTVKTLKKKGYATLRHLLSKEYLIFLSIILSDL